MTQVHSNDSSGIFSKSESIPQRVSGASLQRYRMKKTKRERGRNPKDSRRHKGILFGCKWKLGVRVVKQWQESM